MEPRKYHTKKNAFTDQWQLTMSFCYMKISKMGKSTDKNTDLYLIRTEEGMEWLQERKGALNSIGFFTG